MIKPVRSVLRRIRRRLTPPPPRGRIENYVSEFPASAEAFRRFLRRVPRQTPAGAGAPAGIAIIPWVSTPVPWYAIALAFALQARGRHVTLIYDDLPFTPQPESLATQRTYIEPLLEASGLPVIRLSSVAPAAALPDDEQALARVALLNETWLTRAEAADPVPPDLTTGLFAPMAATLRYLRGLFTQQPFAYIVEPGGIFGTSALVRLAAAERDLRVATYDCNLGVMQVSVDGIAAQQTDLPRAFAALLQLPEAEQIALADLARRSLQRRRAGSDRAQYQVATGTAQPLTAEVILPLNVEHDSGALGLHHIFPSTAAWLRTAVGTVLNESPATVIVRQHPAERRFNERSLFPIAGILREAFGEHPRLRFVAAEESVNTYDLIEAARLVLPFASTIGIEAAALGKPVLMAGASSYSQMGFTWNATSVDEYVQLLRRGLTSGLELKPNQVHNAWLAYYLTPICNRVWTEFTPQPPDYWKWCGQLPRALYAKPAVVDLLTAIDENQPLALVRHTRRLTQPASFVSGM